MSPQMFEEWRQLKGTELRVQEGIIKLFNDSAIDVLLEFD